MGTKTKDTRGFASMSKRRRHEIASKGGISVPAEKRSFAADRELAKEAGSKGGSAVDSHKRAFAKNRELARAAGRLGARRRGSR